MDEGVEGSEDLVEYGEGEDGGCGQEQDNEENLGMRGGNECELSRQ